MTDVPAAIPDTLPETSTVATEILLLLHVPPPVASDNAVIAPAQTRGIPVMLAGNGFTVTTRVLKQPVVESLYVMVVVPAETPVITPVPEIVATVVVLLVQVPLIVASLTVEVDDTHTLAAPDIGAGTSLTVIVNILKHPVPSV